MQKMYWRNGADEIQFMQDTVSLSEKNSSKKSFYHSDIRKFCMLSHKLADIPVKDTVQFHPS